MDYARRLFGDYSCHKINEQVVSYTSQKFTRQLHPIEIAAPQEIENTIYSILAVWSRDRLGSNNRVLITGLANPITVLCAKTYSFNDTRVNVSQSEEYRLLYKAAPHWQCAATKNDRTCNKGIATYALLPSIIINEASAASSGLCYPRFRNSV